MKGRLKSALWIVIGANFVVLVAVLLLAYSAGKAAHGVISDAPAPAASWLCW